LRPWLAFALIASATFSSCSDSSETRAPSAGIDAEAGAGNAVGEGGAADAEPTAGGSPAVSGGADAGPGAMGVAGQDSSGGTSTSAGAGPDASGGAAMVAEEQLSFCPRLTTPALSAFNVTRAYDHAVYADCRVSWVTNLYLVPGERDTFLNNLLTWSLRFWGCQPPPIDDFALIYQEAPLTSADAGAIIDDYLLVATDQLMLSTQESDDMRAALVRLSRQTVAEDSADFSHSTCDTTGGTGGTGGQPASAGSAGVTEAAGGANP